MASISTPHIKKIGLTVLSTTGCVAILKTIGKEENGDTSPFHGCAKNQSTSLAVLNKTLKLGIFSTPCADTGNDFWNNFNNYYWSGNFSKLSTGAIHCEAKQHDSEEEMVSSNSTSETSSKIQTDEPKALSRTQRILYSCGILRRLPVPRKLTSRDPLFEYREMKSGLKQRSRDENELRKLQKEAIEARNSKSPELIHDLFTKVSAIAYGLSPQDRENFLTRYGCSAWTEEILSFIEDVSKYRGIVEIGAGNGQWARALLEHSRKLGNNFSNRNNSHDDYILAYDTMQDLPLSPKIYHSHTQPAHDYFYDKVRKCSSHNEAVRRMSSRGRVLLLVYPPPGPMAVETIKAYVDIYPQGNDTVIYVGEGRGGANGNDELFDYLCNDSGEWAIIKIMDVQKSLKGYEKCFCFQRIQK